MADVSAVPPTLGAALRAAGERYPGALAVASPARRMSFFEMDAASTALAARLLASGVGKGSRVGLWFTYGHEWLVCWWAVVRIGALAVPLSTLARPAELSELVRRSDVHTLLAPAKLLDRDVAAALREALPDLHTSTSTELRLRTAPFLRQIWLTDDQAGSTPLWATALDLDDPSGDVELVAAAEERVVPADLAVVVHTSGSTAEPKGVVHTHGSVLRGSAPIRDEFRRSTDYDVARVLCAMPFFWVGGVLTVVSAVLAPATLLTLPRFEPGPALHLVEEERATYLMGWATVTQSMRSHPDFATRDLRSLPQLTEGPAEIALVDVPVPGVPRHRGMSETMGTFADVAVRIVDPETGIEVGPGVEGELQVRGPGLMHGYYNRERHDVLDPDGWYSTGDRAYLLAGHPTPFYVGRYTEMIKTAGANVAPREVELVAESLPEVKHCVVLGLDSEERGEEVAAVVVAETGAVIDPAVLSTRLREQLAPYKVPTRWFTGGVEEIPWLGSGKPDKPTLRRRLAAGELTETSQRAHDRSMA